MKILISMILGITGTMCFPWILKLEEEGLAYSNSSFAFFVGILSSFAIYHILNTVDFHQKRGVLCAFLFSIIMIIALVFGKQLDLVENVDFKQGTMWLAMIVLTAYFTIFTVKAFSILDQTVKNRADKGAKVVKGEKIVEEERIVGDEKSYCSRWGKVKSVALTWLGLLLCWLPVFLAFYPGAFVYDAQDEYVQVATRIFTTHHPLVHVLLLGGSLVFANKFFDSYNIGIALYTIFQMIVLAGGFTYILYFLKKQGMPKIGRILTFLFFGFFPMIPMYAVCSSKDTLFTLALVIVFVLLLDNRVKNYGFIFVVFSVGMMLFRNNGVYAYAVFFLITLVIRKSEYAKLSVLMFIAIIGYFSVSWLLAFVLQANSTGKQEILTVPMQQIARVYEYTPEVFTEEQKETLYEVLSEEALATYTPNISDIMKSQFNNEAYAADSDKYQKLWLDIGLQKPLIYMNAWFLTSYGYWYPDTIINVYGGTQRFTYMYEDSSFFGFETELPGERDSKFPWLEEIYRKISLEIYQQKLPVLSMAFSPGFMFLLYVFVGVYLFYVKAYKALHPMLLFLLLWGTVILGPTYLVRYVLFFWFALPILLWLVVNNTKLCYTT